MQIISEKSDNEAQTTFEEAIMIVDNEVFIETKNKVSSPSEETQITSEEALMTVDNKVIVH